MPRPRYENLDPEKKKKLLDAATVEFAAHGFELASINTILERAELSKGSFYYYFDDKADLAITLVGDIARDALEPLRQMPIPSTVDQFWAELRKMALRRFEVMRADRQRYDAMVRLATTLFNDPARVAKLPMVFEAQRLMAGFFERGVALGAIRSDIALGTMIALVQGLKTNLYQAMYPAEAVPTDAEMEAFADLVLDLAQRITAKR